MVFTDGDVVMLGTGYYLKSKSKLCRYYHRRNWFNCGAGCSIISRNRQHY